MIRSSHPSGSRLLLFDNLMSVTPGLYRPQKTIGAIAMSNRYFHKSMVISQPLCGSWYGRIRLKTSYVLLEPLYASEYCNGEIYKIE